MQILNELTVADVENIKRAFTNFPDNCTSSFDAETHTLSFMEHNEVTMTLRQKDNGQLVVMCSKELNVSQLQIALVLRNDFFV